MKNDFQIKTMAKQSSKKLRLKIEEARAVREQARADSEPLSDFDVAAIRERLRRR